MFLNFSRPIDEFIDNHYDMVLTAAPCGSGESDQLLNTGHMLIQNTKTALSTMRSVWGLWNHSHCKYGEKQMVMGSTVLCRSVNGRARYVQGVTGALMSVLGHCEACGKKAKYTGFRAFNSLYPCHGQVAANIEIPPTSSELISFLFLFQGDLIVHLPGLNATQRQAVAQEFEQHADLDQGTYDDSRPLLSPGCKRHSEHSCNTRKACDKLYHGLNTHGKCPSTSDKKTRGR